MYFFIVGSTFNGRWKDIARSGWGIAITNSHTTTTSRGDEIAGCSTALLGEIWGHLPGREQCNYRAEVYAPLMVMLHLEREGASNIVVYIVTDCKGVLGGWENGDTTHFMEGQWICGDVFAL